MAADAYSLAQLNVGSELERLAAASQGREASLATGRQKQGVTNRVTREIEKAQAAAARRARRRAKKRGMWGKIASFGLGFVPGAGIYLSALASSLAQREQAKIQKYELNKLTRNLDLGWMGKTFAKSGVKDWKEDVKSQAKDIDPDKIGLESFATNLAMSFAMQGITEGIESGIENAKAGSEFQNIKDNLPEGTKFKNIKARKILNQKNSTLVKVPKGTEGATKFDPKADYGLKDPTYKVKGVDTQYKMPNKGGNIAEGDLVLKGSIADRAKAAGAQVGFDAKEFFASTRKGMQGDDWAKLIQALTPEESTFDIQSNPMQYIGRYQ